MDLSQFSHLQKNSQKSFHRQKALIKKVLAGQQVHCETCGQTVVFVSATDNCAASIQCKRKCTDIQLDIVD